MVYNKVTLTSPIEKSPIITMQTQGDNYISFPYFMQYIPNAVLTALQYKNYELIDDNAYLKYTCKDWYCAFTDEYSGSASAAVIGNIIFKYKNNTYNMHGIGGAMYEEIDFADFEEWAVGAIYDCSSLMYEVIIYVAMMVDKIETTPSASYYAYIKDNLEIVSIDLTMDIKENEENNDNSNNGGES